jgi:hypothetical protein
MSAPILVRVDHINATTDPVALERVLAPLFAARIPVSLATIPRVALGTRSPDGARAPWLHPSSADVSVCENIVPSTPIAQWMRRHHLRIDVLLHGLTHRRGVDGTEFGTLDREEAERRIRRGIDVLSAACGSRPVGFVAPWDRLSAGTVEAVDATLPLLCSSELASRTLPPRAWLAHGLARWKRTEAFSLRQAWALVQRPLIIGAQMPVGDVERRLDEAQASARVAMLVIDQTSFGLAPDGEPPVMAALAKTLRHRKTIAANDVPGLLGGPKRASVRPPRAA